MINLSRRHSHLTAILKTNQVIDYWTIGAFRSTSNICAFNLYNERVNRYTAIELWDIKRKVRVAHWRRSSYGSKALAFSNDGTLMAEWAGGGNRNDYSRFVRIYRVGGLRFSGLNTEKELPMGKLS